MPQANPHNCHRVRPGPKAVFTKRLVVKVRPDQFQALVRIAAVLELTPSDVVRWFLDNGIEGVESVPTYQALKEQQ